VSLVGRAEGRRADFDVCPHCWHVNGALSRVCLKCRGDMTLVLQESGGERWTAPAQSPMPVPGGRRLSVGQRILLFGFLVLFGIAQLLYAVAPSTPSPIGAPVPGGR
jgi:hypothetical protein